MRLVFQLAVVLLLPGLDACSLGSPDDAPGSDPPAYDAAFGRDAIVDASGDGDALAVDAGLDAPANDGSTFDAPADAGAPAAGAHLTADGAHFRVWALHATQVFVAFDFDAWDATKHELAAEGGGWFAGEVVGPKAGDGYQYVIHNGAAQAKKNDPRALRMTASSSGNALLYDEAAYAWGDSAWKPPPFEEQVVYELHVGTFYVGPTGAGRPGTYADVAAKLDHLASIGVNMIELLPIHEFAGDYSWGYGPSFLFAPESAYGAPDDFKRLVDAAHARGIGVILDVVHNHYGRADLSMWCFDLDCLGPGNGGAYFYTAPKIDTGYGPRPDYARAEMRSYVLDDAKMWLDGYHVDGLRWDSVVNIRRYSGGDLPEGLSLLRAMNDARDARKVMIAEDLQDDAAITRATSAGGAGFDSQWDPGFFYPMKQALIATTDAARSMTSVRDALTHSFGAKATTRLIFTEDHDQVSIHNGAGNVRIPEGVSPGDAGNIAARKRSTLGASILLTAPGIPMLFMGQEFLENQDFAFNAKLPLDWSKETTYAGMQRLWTDLIHLRRNISGTTRGLLGSHVEVFHVNDVDKVIAYRRWDAGGDDVIVLANFGARTYGSYVVGLPSAGTWRVRFNGDSKTYGADFGDASSADVTTIATARDGMAQQGSVALGAYAAVILSR